jgi:hypothetical protein
MFLEKKAKNVRQSLANFRQLREDGKGKTPLVWAAICERRKASGPIVPWNM